MKNLIEKASVIVGKKCKNEADAKKALVKFLESNDIDGMDDEDLETLIDIAESYAPEVANVDVDNSDVDEVEEAEELAAEAEAEEVEEVEEVEEEDGDEFSEMDRNDLKNFIKENGLSVKVTKKMSDDDVREAIREAIAEEAEEVEEVEEVEEEPEKTKKAKKAAPAKKEETTKKAAPAKKETKKEPKPRVKTMSPKDNPDDFKNIKKALLGTFSEKEYEFSPIASGVTVKYKGSNLLRGVVKVENCSVLANGEIKCNAYFNIIKGNESLAEKTGEEFEHAWDNTPMIKNIVVSDVCSIISTVMKEVKNLLNKKDEKLGKNKEKMEKELAKKSAPAKKEETTKKTDQEKKAEKNVTAKKEETKQVPAKKAKKK